MWHNFKIQKNSWASKKNKAYLSNSRIARHFRMGFWLLAYMQNSVLVNGLDSVVCRELPE